MPDHPETVLIAFSLARREGLASKGFTCTGKGVLIRQNALVRLYPGWLL